MLLRRMSPLCDEWLGDEELAVLALHEVCAGYLVKGQVDSGLLIGQ